MDDRVINIYLPSDVDTSGFPDDLYGSYPTTPDYRIESSWMFYLMLRSQGIGAQICNEFPDSGILLIHKAFAKRFVWKPNLFVVSMQWDYKRDDRGQVHLVSNHFKTHSNSLGWMDRTSFSGLQFFVQPPMHPSLIPRSASRGDQFENIAFLGAVTNLEPELCSDFFKEQIEALGMRFVVIDDPSKMTDYSEIDAVLAVRNFGESIVHKPAQKLINAWRAGVPALLGHEVGYQELHDSDRDYIEIDSVDEVIQALEKLKDDVSFRNKMIRNGLEKSENYTAEAIEIRWGNLFRDRIFPACNEWLATPRPRRCWFLAVRRVRYLFRSALSRLAQLVRLQGDFMGLKTSDRNPVKFESDGSAQRMIANGVFTAARFFVYTLSGVFFIPYLVRKFGAGAYGLIALAGFLTQYVGLVQRCVGNAVARFLNISLNRCDWKQANEIFCTSLVANLGFILLQLPILALAVWKLDWLFDFSPEIASDFRILVICNVFVFFISMITGVVSTPIQASNRLDITSTVDSVRIIIRLVLLVVLIQSVGAKLWIIGVVDLFLAVLNNMFITIMCRRLAPELTFRWRHVTRRWVRPVLNMAGWSMVTALGAYMFVKTDIWMINRFVNKEIAGVYAALLVWPNFLRQISKQLASILAPVYMIDYARGDLERVARMSLSAAKLLGCFVGLCVGGLYVIAEPLLELWLGSGAAQYVGLFHLMLVYLTFTIGEAVLWQVYTTINKVHYTGIVSILAGAVNVVVSLSLIHAGFGAIGVAIGTAFAQILSSSLAIPLGVCHEFHIPLRTVGWNHLYAGLSLLVAFLASQLSWNLYGVSKIGGIFCFVIMMAAGLVFVAGFVFTPDERRLVGRFMSKLRAKLGMA